MERVSSCPIVRISSTATTSLTGRTGTTATRLCLFVLRVLWPFACLKIIGNFRHTGNVPGISERLDYQSDFGLRPRFPLHPDAVVCPRGTYQEGSDCGASHTRRWLIDSESGCILRPVMCHTCRISFARLIIVLGCGRRTVSLRRIKGSHCASPSCRKKRVPFVLKKP